MGLGELQGGGVHTWSLLLVFLLGSPWVLPHLTWHTGGGACTEEGSGLLTASCSSMGVSISRDGGGVLTALSWGFPGVCNWPAWSTHPIISFPWVCKWHGSGEDSGGAHAASLWGFPYIREWSSEDSGGGNSTSAGLCLLWLGFLQGGAGSDGSGGHFATSCSASHSQWGWWRWGCSCYCSHWVIVMQWPPCHGVSLMFAIGVGPVRTAVVVTLPLLSYACCGWAFFKGVQAARVVVVISPPHTLLLVASGGGGDGAVPVIVTIRSSLLSLWSSAPCSAHGKHLQGPATCLGGGELVSGWGWQMATHLHLVPLFFPPSHSCWPLWWSPYVSGGEGGGGGKWLNSNCWLNSNHVNFVT